MDSAAGDSISDPFAVLDLPENPDDAEVRTRYLALVREHSPERDPERFEVIRAAYDAVRTRRDRLRLRLFSAEGLALARLKRDIMALPDAAADASPRHADRKTVNALLREGIDRWAERVLNDAAKG